MRARTWLGFIAAVAACINVAAAQTSAGKSAHADRVRILVSQQVPPLTPGDMKVVLLEVHYGPGESSPPHSHPCAVIAYVLEGEIRSQVGDGPIVTYRPGETFYEAPNGVHAVSANASATQPARFLAYMVCDKDAQLSVPPPAPKEGHRP